jgi:hypothetical protein
MVDAALTAGIMQMHMITARTSESVRFICFTSLYLNLFFEWTDMHVPMARGSASGAFRMKGNTGTMSRRSHDRTDSLDEGADTNQTASRSEVRFRNRCSTFFPPR